MRGRMRTSMNPLHIPRAMRLLAALALLTLAIPLASAGAEEFPLPAGWEGPTHLEFDAAGTLWVVLDGSWALGRFDPNSKTGAIYPLGVARTPEAGLGGIDVATDGTVWLGTPRHLVQLYPGNGSFNEYALPGTSLVSGDVHVAPDGIVWYALTSADLLLRLDPKDGNTTTFPLPNKPFGPLEFKEDDGGFYVTATYANTYARYDPATSGLAIGRASVAGPVGIDEDPQGKLWIAEMGASTVSHVEHATGRLERYPTSHSPYYPTSGPAGIHVQPDGVVWFVEHFADRISRLDHDAKTLHEYEVPSAPGTNVQFLAPAKDGSIWFAEFSKNQIGRVTFTDEPVLDQGPDNITVRVGGKVEIEVGPVEGASLVAAGPDETLNATVANGKLVVTAAGTAVPTKEGAPPSYVLLTANHGKYTAGRYIPVTIAAAEKDTPGLAVLALVGVAVIVALAGRRA